MARRLTGQNPLSYLGVDPVNPTQAVIDNRNPTVNDYDNFQLQCQWLNSITYQMWMLVNKAGFVATWIEIAGGGGGGIQTITGDIGGAVPPDGTNTIFLQGGGPYVFTGTPGANLITLTDDGTVGRTITGNSGGPISPAAGNWNLVTANSTPKFVGAGSTITLDFGLGNLVLGSSLPTAVGNHNVGLGNTNLNSLITGANNVAIGNTSGNGITGGANNVGVGSETLRVAANSTNNVAIGYQSLRNLTAGSNNTAVGMQTGTAYTTNESSNILIGSVVTGTVLDGNTIRIGVNGGAAGQQNKCFVAGISGVNIGSTANVVSINTGTSQLGTTAITAGAGVTVTPGANTITIAATPGAGMTITGNTGGALSPTAGNWNIVTANSTPVFSGSVSTETLDFNLSNLVLGSSLPALAGGLRNVGVGSAVLASLTSGVQNTVVGYQAGTTLNSASNNTLVGYLAGNLITTGSGNTFVGGNAGLSVTTGTSNTAIGQLALTNATTGAANSGGNVAVGNSALLAVTTGTVNTAVGTTAAALLLTGTSNLFLGNGTGSAYTTAESSNILLKNTGVVGESNTIRIGTTGAGVGQQNRLFVAGTTGVNVGSTAQVVTMGTAGTAEQLGTAVITAGTGITVTPGANTITIATTGTAISFLAYASASVPNVTGDGTAYLAALDSTLFNNGGGYNTGTFLFTAPTTGIYQFNAVAYVDNLDPAHDAGFAILEYFAFSSTSAQVTSSGNWGAMADFSGGYGVSLSGLFHMDAADTVKLVIQVYDGTKTVGMVGNVDATLFSGYRVA